MLKDISLNTFCDNIIEEFHFQYKSVDNVLTMLQEVNYMAVVDSKSACKALPIFPDHRRYLGSEWEINGEYVYIETLLWLAPWAKLL